MAAPVNSFWMALRQELQQTCTSFTVTAFTLPVEALADLISSALPSQVALPKKPPLARLAKAFLAVSASLAVNVTVLVSRSQAASETPSTLLRMLPTDLTQAPQHRWTP